MIELPNMLMIGAAERKLGKTTFATEIIRRYRNTHPVIAVKITTLTEEEQASHGTCDHFSGNYCISEERTGPEGKGTTRMLEAGAARVFWLEVYGKFMDEAFNDLLERIPKSAPVICESNSARRAVKPSLFLVIKRKDSTEIKDSRRDVIEHANRIIEFNGSGWNLQPEQVTFNGSRWLIT